MTRATNPDAEWEAITARIDHDDEANFAVGIEWETCSACDGSGEGQYEGVRCSRCNGRGSVPVEVE